MAGKKQKRVTPRASRARGSGRTPWGAILLAIVVIAGAGWWYARRTPAPTPAMAESSPEVRATVENTTPPPASGPEGMVWIPGGEFSMGAAEQPGMNDVGMQATLDSRPIHRVYVDGFWMDATEVTNAQFAQFVDATSYVTVAERTPRAEDFPGAPPENLVAGAVVFSPPRPSRPARQSFPVVDVREGRELASSRRPRQQHRGRDQYPVVQIAYEMRWRTRSGPGNGCPPKPSGNLRHEAG